MKNTKGNCRLMDFYMNIAIKDTHKIARNIIGSYFICFSTPFLAEIFKMRNSDVDELRDLAISLGNDISIRPEELGRLLKYRPNLLGKYMHIFKLLHSIPKSREIGSKYIYNQIDIKWIDLLNGGKRTDESYKISEYRSNPENIKKAKTSVYTRRLRYLESIGLSDPSYSIEPRHLSDLMEFGWTRNPRKYNEFLYNMYELLSAGKALETAYGLEIPPGTLEPMSRNFITKVTESLDASKPFELRKGIKYFPHNNSEKSFKSWIEGNEVFDKDFFYEFNCFVKLDTYINFNSHLLGRTSELHKLRSDVFNSDQRIGYLKHDIQILSSELRDLKYKLNQNKYSS